MMSFRRQTFMILNAEFQSLNTSAKTTLLVKNIPFISVLNQ